MNKKLPEDFDPRAFPWFEVLEVLLNDYQPAEKDTVETWWRTSEIVQSIAKHFGTSPDEINPQEVYMCMLYLDYHFARNGDLNLEWMLRLKS